MKRVLRGSETHKTRHIADDCFYIIPQDQASILFSTFDEAIAHIPPENRILDPVALLSLLLFGYVCGDRTLVRGLNRIPLHATVNSDGYIVRDRQIAHSCIEASIQDITQTFLALIADEIESVVHSESEVVILLTGGLDSRVTAGILRRLQHKYEFVVRAVTWGAKNSRDWVFSDRICELFDWSHINVPIGPETLWENIKQSVDIVGAEVSGEHFHGMRLLEKYIPKHSLILGSSYGDSIGRAEFSGTHVESLRFENPRNRDGMFYQAWFRRSVEDLNRDMREPWTRGDTKHCQEAIEISLQENYMRRMLNPLMQSLSGEFRLYQVFTAEPVVSFMWSLDLSHRDDRMYQTLIPQLDLELARIPWAKTNQALVRDAWPPDVECSRNFHDYPRWIQVELRDRFESFLMDYPIEELLYVNHRHIRSDWERFQKMDAHHPSFQRISRRFARITGVLMLMHDYEIVCDDSPFAKSLSDNSTLLVEGTWRIRDLRRRYLRFASRPAVSDSRFLPRKPHN